MAPENDELWDIYNKDREKTGRLHKRCEPMKEGEYHLVVHVCIFNSKNEMLIQQRQPFKSGWPNLWDVSVGGSAVAGDSSTRAAEREVFEELGITIDLSKSRPEFTNNFSSGFDDFYFVYQDVDLSELRLQKEEVRAVRWAGKEELLRMQEEGTLIPYWHLSQLFDLTEWKQIYRNPDKISFQYASEKNLASFLNLLEIIKNDYKEFETEEMRESFRTSILVNIKQRTVICAMFGNIVVGFLLYAPENQQVNFLAVHPEFRQKGIEEKMLRILKNANDSAKETT